MCVLCVLLHRKHLLCGYIGYFTVYTNKYTHRQSILHNIHLLRGLDTKIASSENCREKCKEPIEK